MDEHYDLAMCDCKSWESYIGAAIGGEGAKPIKHYDPKAEFQRAFTRAIAAGEKR